MHVVVDPSDFVALMNDWYEQREGAEPTYVEVINEVGSRLVDCYTVQSFTEAALDNHCNRG